MARELPQSMINAVRTMGVLVLLSAAAVVLVWVQSDEVIRAWARGNSSAQEILASGGMAALREAAITPKFVPLAVVSFIVFLVLVVVLVAFLVDGHGWARFVLLSVCLFGALVATLVLTYGLPMGFMVVAALSLAGYVVLAFFLWRKDTSAYLRVN